MRWPYSALTSVILALALAAICLVGHMSLRVDAERRAVREQAVRDSTALADSLSREARAVIDSVFRAYPDLRPSLEGVDGPLPFETSPRTWEDDVDTVGGVPLDYPHPDAIERLENELLE